MGPRGTDGGDDHHGPPDAVAVCLETGAALVTAFERIHARGAYKDHDYREHDHVGRSREPEVGEHEDGEEAGGERRDVAVRDDEL